MAEEKKEESGSKEECCGGGSCCGPKSCGRGGKFLCGLGAGLLIAAAGAGFFLAGKCAGKHCHLQAQTAPVHQDAK